MAKVRCSPVFADEATLSHRPPHNEGGLRSWKATLEDDFDHFDSTDEGQSVIVMDVHSVGFLENWGFGDFQFLNSNPNE